jgi:hypothetical protein
MSGEGFHLMLQSPHYNLNDIIKLNYLMWSIYKLLIHKTSTNWSEWSKRNRRLSMPSFQNNSTPSINDQQISYYQSYKDPEVYSFIESVYCFFLFDVEMYNHQIVIVLSGLLIII